MSDETALLLFLSLKIRKKTLTLGGGKPPPPTANVPFTAQVFNLASGGTVGIVTCFIVAQTTRKNCQRDQSMRPSCNRSFGQLFCSRVALPAAQYLGMAQRPITAFLKRSADESGALAQRKTAKKAGSTVLNLMPWHSLQNLVA